MMQGLGLFDMRPYASNIVIEAVWKWRGNDGGMRKKKITDNAYRRRSMPMMGIASPEILLMMAEVVAKKKYLWMGLDMSIQRCLCY